jgi:nucleoside 2-deoxyribosyltransferase
MNEFNKIFIAGVIQGSHQDKSIHSQDYRQELRTLLASAFPNAEIYDPFEGHENSIEYDDIQGRTTFLSGIKAVLESDLVIAYLPHASLGTAIEVWESYRKGIPVWTISPMKTNWVVRFCSDIVFENIDDFASYLQNNHSVVEKS